MAMIITFDHKVKPVAFHRKEKANFFLKDSDFKREV